MITSTAITSCVDPGGGTINDHCLRQLLSGVEVIASCVDPGEGWGVDQ